jgi:hypothetical protein
LLLLLAILLKFDITILSKNSFTFLLTLPVLNIPLEVSTYFVMFDGEKYYEEDIEYADYHDLGKLPRLEDGKLIVTNPAWEM